MAEEQQQDPPESTGGNIINENNLGRFGLNMDNTVNQVPQGVVTYALNAAVENFDASSVNYQNEPGNEFCLVFPDGYRVIGTHFINEKNKHIFYLANPSTGDSEIGYMVNNDCVYRTYVNAKCLNFNIYYPIHKTVHKITNCTTEIYWTDGLNPRRYLDLDNIESVYTNMPGTNVCDNILIPVIDCNKLKVQPNFTIPNLKVVGIETGGQLKAGTYQFAIQYCDSVGDGYTSYYSVTNPTPIADVRVTTPNFDYPVGKSIILNIDNIDVTGYYKYYNLAVIKTINAITSVELVGTYFIDDTTKTITYTGQNQEQIRLSIDDIFEKFPYYDIAQDVTSAQDVLIWDNLTSIDRINYQQIASQITLQWETYRLPTTDTTKKDPLLTGCDVDKGNYKDELNATNYRGYLRDEIYAFEIVFLLKNGKQTDGFHIPGRVAKPSDLVLVSNQDVLDCNTVFPAPQKRWQVYNTGTKIGYASGASGRSDYEGPWEYGDFAYWESTELYPCNENVWGDLANQPIRHHKFPDVLVSPIYQSKIYDDALPMQMGNVSIFPIGVRIDTSQVANLIASSNLTDEQKSNIAGFKIVRGDRNTNKSIVGKGILRNVGKYEREGTQYYYPNYPYNDLREDPFILSESNAFFESCKIYKVNATSGSATIEYVSCITNKPVQQTVVGAADNYICSLSYPLVVTGTAIVAYGTYGIYHLNNDSPGNGVKICYRKPETPDVVDSITLCGQLENVLSQILYGCTCSQTCSSGCCHSDNEIRSIIKPYKCGGSSGNYGIHLVSTVTPPPSAACSNPNEKYLSGFQDYFYRYVFNSPETSFGQPFLGNILKLENVMYGAGKAHFVEVKDHAKYKLLTKEAQNDAIKSSADISNGDWTATFTAYQAYLQIYINGITRKNYTYSFNSIADYNYGHPVPNDLGIKQRQLSIANYLIPGVQGVGDDHDINNWNRESSVYLKTKGDPFLRPDNVPNWPSFRIIDKSRFTISDIGNCIVPAKEQAISVVSYYASLKNEFVNQWGQIYSYDTIDTGFQIDLDQAYTNPVKVVFGGDTFISRFAFKTKFPFFIDNRVNAPNDSDIFYDEIGNVAYPKYWFSGRSVLSDVTDLLNSDYNLTNFISSKAHYFDCPNTQLPGPPTYNPGRTYYDGKMYLFAYGVPYFYCESSINTDLRQAFNDKEGDFWPHVSTGIPDDWVQEKNVSIAQDNTYYYNITYSKQNKENYFSHLPIDWTQDLCKVYFPFRAIYSDVQVSYADSTLNSWLIYRPLSRFDFPQNYGKLISLDGIQNKGVLARFENKSLLYNKLLTIDTSNPKAAYVGNPNLFDGAPPVDFAETDLGYVGTQHKFLLKIPQGQVTADAKRGQIFLSGEQGIVDLSAFKSGLNRFFTDHLPFEILRQFPEYPIDNHFNGMGLHGVFDAKYDRIIFTKLDYAPKSKDIQYDPVTHQFYIPVPDCTTTTTTSSTSTTSSTTTAPPNCQIDGNALAYDCNFNGTAVIVPPSTTTTTSTTITPTPTSSTTSTTTTIII